MMEQPDSEGPPLRVVIAAPGHLQATAELLMKSFPRMFTSHMGLRYVRGLCNAYLEDPHGIAFVAIEQQTGIAKGFVIGGDPDIRSKFQARCKMRFAHTLLFRCLADRIVRSAVLARIAASLRPGRRANTTPPQEEGNVALLQFIAVDPRYQGTGAAGALMQEFLCACRARGYERARLTVPADNSRAIAFYCRTGWKIVWENPQYIGMNHSIPE
jgi:ribosomal protein S18 acetylase RimI-like enzyme